MKDDFKTVFDALIKAGFHQLPEKNPGTGKPFDFKITPYSLNTTLSFKFENLEHFTEFLKRAGVDVGNQLLLLTNTFVELGLDPAQFFYVNFYEKDKDLEM
ncbi:MAG: hypothetical protein CFE23_04855 [Flavobacterium sp. BFFFF1]|uniref:hypothetical protein n=1 Tax=Flavobacterium sp. BFFFF1 TaxID=2015557 RepID=UPI000BCC2BF5|nr:hypothetical protein [Flavobacterium sp. BFFFF1]OYU81419.1 MAG: hypothetical protein CFE23_04855 [Flavobacterium sp. BFFFF1]